MSDTYVEVVGNVVDATTIKMLGCINLGSDLGEFPSSELFLCRGVVSSLHWIIDMKLVNDTIELIHDPRFYSKMFC
jgi:replication factor A3